MTTSDGESSYSSGDETNQVNDGPSPQAKGTKKRKGVGEVEAAGKKSRRDNKKKDARTSSKGGKPGGRPPVLSISTAASVSSLSHGGYVTPNNGGSVHYSESESSAVREYVRSEIYPKKKTIFCDEELMYGSALANKVIEFVIYAKEGLYRMKREPTFAGRKAVEVGFWTRNQETVRRVLKEKVNNSLSRFKEKLESKCRGFLGQLVDGDSLLCS